MLDYRDLLEYAEIDAEKMEMLESLIESQRESELMRSVFNECDDYSRLDDDYYDLESDYVPVNEVSESHLVLKRKQLTFNVCPKCRKSFPDGEIICPDCLVRLRNPEDINDITSMEIKSDFPFKGSNNYDSFEELLSMDNFKKINESDFDIVNYDDILQNIKKTAFLRLNRIIKDYNIKINSLDILDVVMLFTKSFVNVDYKSSGMELGYFEFNKIYIDDRQSKSLQITTMLHELTHFLIKEIFTHTICKLLDATKNSYIEAFITYILTASSLNQLIDEYAAHSVEARFTIFGYQDYSSFVNIQKNVDAENVEIAKIIGNTFANKIKDILEDFLDRDLREEIKSQFRKDIIESPDYNQMTFETCKNLNDDGLCQSVLMILNEGFNDADLEILNNYEKQLR